MQLITRAAEVKRGVRAADLDEMMECSICTKSHDQLVQMPEDVLGLYRVCRGCVLAALAVFPVEVPTNA